MLIPYQVDVPMSRWPIANFALIGLTMVVSIGAMFSDIDTESIRPLILDGWSPTGMFGHMFLHAGVVHLIGNMLFLWVFGNAVCAKIGNLPCPFLYLGLGFLAAATHNIFDSGPAIGASGAINGIVGMFLVFYPLNDVTCLYFVIYRGGSFSLSSVWMILAWLVFDIWGATAGFGPVAYWAHLGGFFAGAGLAALILSAGWGNMTSAERSLIELLTRRN
jgi:membrane associated rhomboid family serine protease